MDNIDRLERIIVLKGAISALEQEIHGLARELYPDGTVHPAKKNGTWHVEVEILSMSDMHPRFKVRNTRTSAEYWMELWELMQGAAAKDKLLGRQQEPPSTSFVAKIRASLREEGLLGG